MTNKGEKWKKIPARIEVLDELAKKGGSMSVVDFNELCKTKGVETKVMIKGVGKPVTYVRGGKVVLTKVGIELTKKPEEKPAKEKATVT